MEKEKQKKKRQNSILRGGLRRKIFRLCIVLVITAICGFAILGMLQLNTLLKMANETGKSQAQSIKDYSENSMMALTKDNMENLAFQAADNTDWEIWSMTHETMILANQVKSVLENPDAYGEHDIKPPKKENGGKLALQLLIPDGFEPSEEDMTVVRKLAGIGPAMEEMIRDNGYDTLDLYISLPNGMSVAMDTHSDSKFEEDGTLRPYDPRERPWWKGAIETKEPYFAPAVYSEILEMADIELGVPVYVNGKLAAVVEGSMGMDTIGEIVSKVTYGKTGFSIVISADGKLIYSPRTEGDLEMDELLLEDIRDSGNAELNAVVDKSLTGERGFSEIKLDGEDYFVAYAPMETVHWAQLLFVSKEELEKPTDELLSQLDETTEKTLSKYSKDFHKSIILTIIIMILLIVNAILVALMFSDRLTGPINSMTQKVGEISKDNFVFEMDDSFRTGDEIEVLAKTFGELSERTRGYIKEIMEVTAEKERIGAELNVATKIQADMLPADFPLFPDRNEFDLYATMTPAKEVGGDFYDVFLLDDDHLCMVMADVSGKGVPAALFMVISKTIIKHRAQMGGTPAEILSDVNNKLCEGNKQHMFVTVWLGILTISTGEVIETNAGHEDVIIQRGNGKYELYETVHGIVLGFRENMKYKNDTFVLNPGDALFVYTDGLPEATNAEDNRLENSGMLDAINKHSDDGITELLPDIAKEVDVFVGDAPQFDDLTMMVIRYRGKQEE